MATAPTQDFIVKSGLNVQGTSTVTSSTGNTSTLQVDGGAAIAQNLIVGTDATVYGDLIVYGSIPNISISTGTFTNLIVTDLSTLNAVTAGVTTATSLDVSARLAVGGLSQLNNATLANATNSTSSTTGALTVTGGVGIQKDLWVGGRAYVNGFEVITTATVIASTLQAITEQGSTTTVAIAVLNTTSSTSTDSGALTVVGGVGVGGDIYANALYINTASYINNSLIITTATVDLYATKTSILAGTDTAVNTSTGIVTIWNTSTLQSVTDRGATTNNVIVLTNTQSSTSTVLGNSLQVSGGVGIDGSLYVNGAAYFQNNVIFAGTSTYVYSTNTVYTDNLINLHVPVGSTGTNHDWTVDDGKDIGHVYHYYKGVDYNAFLGLANDTGYLEWYNKGEEVGGIFTGTEYGTFKTGAIILTSTTASVSTTTGALIVAGGVGIGKDLHVGGQIVAASITATIITATHLTVLGSASIPGGLTATNFTTTELVVVGVATLNAFVAAIATVTNLTVSGLRDTGNMSVEGWFTASTATVYSLNILSNQASTSTTTGALVVAGGVGVGGSIYAGDIYSNGSRVLTSAGGSGYVSAINAGTDTAVSSSTGVITIWNTSTLQSVTSRGATTNVAVSITNLTASTGTTNGALKVSGGVGVGDSVYVGNRVGFVNTAGNASAVYQFYNTLTNSLDTVFG